MMNSTITLTLCLVQLYQELDPSSVTFCESRCLCSNLSQKCVPEALLKSCEDFAALYKTKNPLTWRINLKKMGLGDEVEEQEAAERQGQKG